MTIEIEGNFKDFFPTNPGGAVNTDYANATIASYALLILALLLGAVGGACFA